MANIHSQQKRILRTERERLENRRYTSTIKTYFRRLEAAVQGGDDAQALRRALEALSELELASRGNSELAEDTEALRAIDAIAA